MLPNDCASDLLLYRLWRLLWSGTDFVMMLLPNQGERGCRMRATVAFTTHYHTLDINLYHQLRIRRFEASMNR